MQWAECHTEDSWVRPPVAISSYKHNPRTKCCYKNVWEDSQVYVGYLSRCLWKVSPSATNQTSMQTWAQSEVKSGSKGDRKTKVKEMSAVHARATLSQSHDISGRGLLVFLRCCCVDIISTALTGLAHSLYTLQSGYRSNRAPLESIPIISPSVPNDAGISHIPFLSILYISELPSTLHSLYFITFS